MDVVARTLADNASHRDELRFAKCRLHRAGVAA
jgi:hypothetical protein